MIYLVRHGQTKFNVEQRHQGHIDSPLTELGREQARRAGEVLATLIDPRDSVIFSSPLGRALQTATIIADVTAAERSIIVDPDLMEIGMGSAEGMIQADVVKRWAVPGANSTGKTMSLWSPDGENLEALAERLDRALRRIVYDHAGSRVVVTHGVAGRVFQAIYLGLGCADASRFDTPQDTLFCLSDNGIARIPY